MINKFVREAANMISIARGRFNRSQKVKGTVVLMHKNVLDINALTSVQSVTSLIKSGFKVANGIAGSICDTYTSTLGCSVALRLISATNADGMYNYFLISS